MMSRRSKGRLLGSALAPVAFGFIVLYRWLERRQVRGTGWEFASRWDPCYVGVLWILLIVGLIFAVLSIISIIGDCLRHTRTNATGR
jgi:hypothetical protein